MLWEAVRDLVWPATCSCAPRIALAERPRYGMCATCLELLTPNDLPTPTGLLTQIPFLYGGPLADAIAAAKLHGREDLAEGLGRLLADHVTPGRGIIVPVPLHPRRRMQRGYNQAAVLGREVARKHRLAINYGLERARYTSTQRELQLIDRRTNVAGAFRAKQRFSGHITLVDDVVTTGETIRDAARALLEAGATSVESIAIARTPP